MGLQGPPGSSKRSFLPPPPAQKGTPGLTKHSRPFGYACGLRGRDPPRRRPCPLRTLQPQLRQLRTSRSLLPLARSSGESTNEQAGFPRGAAPRARLLTSRGQRGPPASSSFFKFVGPATETGSGRGRAGEGSPGRARDLSSKRVEPALAARGSREGAYIGTTVGKSL